LASALSTTTKFCLGDSLLQRQMLRVPRLLRIRTAHLTTAVARVCPQAPLTPRDMRVFEGGRPFFNVATGFFGEQSNPHPMRVVVLAGFLGAGKTTVLEQLLHKQHGYRLGVIVNDLASVNIDADVLRKSIDSAGAQSISLENGCVCCTAADDLRESVHKLIDGAKSSSLDAVVVELSGVAEPSRVKRLFEKPPESPESAWWGKVAPPLSVRTVTVVDTQAFATDYMGEQSAHHAHGHSVSGECDNRYGTLLAEQVESADLVLLNKADIATEHELLQTQSMVGALNALAETRVTQHGKVGVQELLDIASRRNHETVEPHKVQDVASPVPSCCVAKTCSTTNPDSTDTCSSSGVDKAKTRAETRFGITSFVYTTERMMSRAKLLMVLDKWQKSRTACGDKLSLDGLDVDFAQPSTSTKQIDSPLSLVLRSKGFLLLDVNPGIAFYWSHAGKSVSFSMLGPWPESTSQAEGGFGARRTELVFIGSRYDEDAIRNVMDSCLVDEQELNLQRMGRT